MPLELTDNGGCFVCGVNNPSGLRLLWRTEGNRTESTMVLSSAFQGWKGLAHGGVLSAVLDEAMTRLAWEKFGSAVTAEMIVRYSAAARVGETLTIVGEVDEPKGRLVAARAEIRGVDGRLVASATGKILRVKEINL